MLHRLILGLRKGDARQVDHIDRNPLNNRRSNLRVVTPAENNQNRGGWRNSSSKYKGVSWDKYHNSWKAAIGVGGIQRNLGRYKVEEDAARAYNKAVLKFCDEHAFINEGV